MANDNNVDKKNVIKSSLSENEDDIIKPLEMELDNNDEKNNESNDVIELNNPVEEYSEDVVYEQSEKIVEDGINKKEDDFEIADQLIAEESLDLNTLKLERIEKQVDRIYKDFNSKIKYDAHKEKIIDSLHNELQEYKNGLVNQKLKSISQDIIKVIDDISRFTDHNLSDDNSKINISKLFNYINDIRSDLEDILIMQDIKPFRSEEGLFQPDRQRVLKKVKTDDPSMDKKVVKSLFPGYEFLGKILRPEIVIVNVYAERSSLEDKE